MDTMDTINLSHLNWFAEMFCPGYFLVRTTKTGISYRNHYWIGNKDALIKSINEFMKGDYDLVNISINPQAQELTAEYNLTNALGRKVKYTRVYKYIDFIDMEEFISDVVE